MTVTAEAVGTGALVSPESHQLQLGSDLLGFGAPLEGCPTCHTLDEVYNYGIGAVLNGSWIYQNPAIAGYSSIAAYQLSRKIAIAVVSTFAEASFDEDGNPRPGNVSTDIYKAIGAYLAPDEAPPTRG
jgi:mono/diheme cytochrome c family protein